ncbi:MAG: calcium-binding protein [Nitrososphaeraceae archaeon]
MASFVLFILVFNSINVYGQSSRLDDLNKDSEDVDSEKDKINDLETETPIISVSIKGTSGDNKFKGGDGDDTISGEAGNDILNGMAGDDELDGGDGDDNLEGKDGDDELSGGDGNDELIGGPGKDTMKGGKGGDYFICDDDDKIKDFNSLERDRKSGPCTVDDKGINDLITVPIQ